MTDIKVTVRADCACFYTWPSMHKAPAHWLSAGGVGLWTGIHPLPHPGPHGRQHPKREWVAQPLHLHHTPYCWMLLSSFSLPTNWSHHNFFLSSASLRLGFPIPTCLPKYVSSHTAWRDLCIGMLLLFCLLGLWIGRVEYCMDMQTYKLLKVALLVAIFRG